MKQGFTLGDAGAAQLCDHRFSMDGQPIVQACQLTFLNGPEAGTVRQFGQEHFCLGRDPECALAFDPRGTLTVSARHAEICRTPHGYELRDVSTNGTLVNGKRVRSARLVDGDVIELGDAGPQLRFSVVGPEATRSRWAASMLPTDIVSRTAAYLEIEWRGQRRVFSGPLVRIGRDPSSDVACDPQGDLLVSFNHAKISLVDGRATLFDLESTNGTYVDGRAIRRLDLRGNELIELGCGGPSMRVTVCHAAGGDRLSDKTARSEDTLFTGGEPPATLSLGAATPLSKHPLTQSLTVGRSESCEIYLDSMYVSHEHARIERRDGAVWVRDLGSANGIFVDGQRAEQLALPVGAELVVGPYVLKYDGTAVVVFDTRARAWLAAFGLRRQDSATKQIFLDRVTLSTEPGELICILGPSGSGKSTLLQCLNGYRRPDAGHVLFNNLDFYRYHEQLKHYVAFVPQEEAAGGRLTVERTLYYAAKLRLPVDVNCRKRRERIDDVLSMVELQDHRHKQVAKLSGGQRKRLSIAVELLGEPAILFFDEPTSALDPVLEEKMMILLRDLTLRGKTVMAVTHTVDSITLAHKVGFMVEGRLVFFGSPDQACTFFDVARVHDVYKRLEEHRGRTAALVDAFEQSDAFRLHVASRSRPAETPLPDGMSGKRSNGSGRLRQTAVLTARYLETICRDVRYSLILLLQAPLIALFIIAALASDQPSRGPTSTTLLVMSLSALWFGCSNAAREISKERSAFRREHMVGVRILPYVGSKVLVLQGITLVQVTIMLGLVGMFRPGYALAEAPQECVRWGLDSCSMLILNGVPGDFGRHLLSLYLTGLNGIGLGLLVSAIAGNSDKAMSLVPLVLIPQVLFSGAFGLVPADRPIQRSLGYAMALNWSLDQAKRNAMCTDLQEEGPTGCSTCIHGYDPFKHARLGRDHQAEDAVCSAIVPALGTLTDYPESLQVVEDGLYTRRRDHGMGPPRLAHKSDIGLCVLASMAAAWFGLVCLLLGAKNRASS